MFHLFQFQVLISFLRSFSHFVSSFTCSDAAKWIGCNFYPPYGTIESSTSLQTGKLLVTFSKLSNERISVAKQYDWSPDGVQ